MVKNMPAKAGDTGDASLISGLEISPAVGHGNPLQILAGETPWTEKPGRLPSMGLTRNKQG